jgi:hypothetical protein
MSASLLFGPAAMAPAATISDLLERGIHAEEARGDLDGAIQIYRQILAETKVNQTLAAHAQYRLAVCLYKNRKFPEATLAFEQLVKDFPGEKELIAQARVFMPGDLVLDPVPWRDGEVLEFVFKVESGFRVGMAAYHARRVRERGADCWEVGGRIYAGAQSASRVLVDADTFRPIRSHWRHGLLGFAEARYQPTRVEVVLNSTSEPKILEVDGVVYDNEQAVHLMRRMPLDLGYKTTLPIVSTIAGGVSIPVEIEVAARETVRVAAGEFECFKVALEVQGIKQSFWISTDPNRYAVKFEAGGAIGELQAVRYRTPGGMIHYQDPKFGFSLAAPDDWHFYVHETRDQRKVQLAVIDPMAIANTLVRVQSLEEVETRHRSSLRDWARNDVERNIEKRLKDFKMRAEGWSDVVINGQPAVRASADFAEGNRRKVWMTTCVFGEGTATSFSTEVEVEKLEEFGRQLELVLNSYVAK